jgi:N6-L-threonylcarbamoyladenine synthase
LEAKQAKMHVLGIETSCDETGLALLELVPGPAEAPEQGCKAKLLGHALHSQTEMHERYGGVVPELASRDHMVRVLPLLDECLRQAQFDLRDIDSIGVTQGPGLAGALWVGTSFAYGLGLAIGKPVHPVHHLEGHLLSPLLHLVGETDQASSDHVAQLTPSFPFVALLVSGGHSQFLEVTGIGEYELLGETIDDAAGEAFDKSAQLLGLGYPGGPAVARLAEGGVPGRFRLPRPLLRKQGLDLSFAGLKTAVLTQVQKLGGTQALLKTDAQTCQIRADLAAEVQAAIVELLCEKSMAALDQTGCSQLVVSGGVSANKEMRKRLFQAAEKRAVRVFFPPPALCTDNGVMIAWAAGLRLLSGQKRSETNRPASTPGHDVEGRVLGMQVRPRWPLQDLR